MADDKIFFDEQALSVVDSWLGSSKGSDNKSNQRSEPSISAPLSKVGLGFRGKGPQEPVKDALQLRLDKSNKRKKNNADANEESSKSKRKLDDNNDNDNDDDEDYGIQLHGVVEDMPISRTQIVKKKIVATKSQQKKKPAVENNRLGLGLESGLGLLMI
jgi:hypothetical protein